MIWKKMVMNGLSGWFLTPQRFGLECAGDDDQAGEVCWSSDPLMDWYNGLPSTLDRCQSISGEDDTFYVRGVPAGQLVVLDSGADISLLPYHMSGCGTSKPGGRTILGDGQGERIQTYGKGLHVWNVKASTMIWW